MYKYLPVFAILALFLLNACVPSGNTAHTPSFAILPATVYNINTQKDTLLRTKKGALLKIPAGAFTGSKDSMVQLSLREAYTVADIIRGGLITLSGGKPLSSGGMIQIQTTNTTITLTKPIGVSLPTDLYRKEMQVYKGNTLPDGSIDWTEPRPMQQPDTSNPIVLGETIFRAKCASCHHPTKDATGPALAAVYQRTDKKWLKDFVWSPPAMIAANDPYAKFLFCKWGPTVMTAFPMLSDDEFNALYDYLHNEGRKYGLAEKDDPKASYDSCMVYMAAKAKIEMQLADTAKRSKWLADNGPQVVYKNIVNRNFNRQKLVVPAENKAVYYQFTVNVMGWYNVDMLLKDVPGFVPSSLTVQLLGAYKQDMNVYLVVPTEKLFITGGVLKGSDDKYGFFTDDGKIPLPVNKLAYIISFSEVDSQIVYGARAFITTQEQELTLRLTPVSPQDFEQEIRKLDIKDLPINVAGSKNAVELRALDKPVGWIDSLTAQLKQLEKGLKPRNVECPCKVGGSVVNEYY